jgi:hypothetical protein
VQLSVSSNRRNATAEQVTRVEQAIDASLEELALPGDEYFEALWHFLTVSEDLPRLMILSNSKSATPVGESDGLFTLNLVLSAHKYALRYILDVINRRLPKARRLQKRIQAAEVPYTTAARGLEIARDYRKAVGLFTLYHSGNALCTTDESGDNLWFSFPWYSAAYQALDYSVDVDLQGNAITALFAWLTYPAHAPTVVKQIGDSVAVAGNDRLVYKFNEYAVAELAGILPNPTPWNLVPQTWVFPWGDREEVMALMNTLELRCLYHVLAINFGADRWKVAGGGVNDLCLRVKRGQLVQEIKRVSKAPLDRIVKFVHGLTHGKGTRTPDPALQPLIPFGEDELLVPCMHVLSSKGGRNLLSLHARVDEKSFNSQSTAFEEAMLEEVASLASGRFPFVRTQLQFDPTGEIDLVIVEEKSATILIGELRWMIAPGDARETVNRIKVCREKVRQVEKKAKRINENTVKFLRHLRWKGYSSGTWEVVGLVITENFVVRSSNTDIPVFPLAVLRAGLDAGMDVRQLYLWAKSERWLPKEGRHFDVIPTEVRFKKHALRQHGVTKLRSLEYVTEFLPKSASEFMEPNA